MEIGVEYLVEQSPETEVFKGVLSLVIGDTRIWCIRILIQWKSFTRVPSFSSDLLLPTCMGRNLLRSKLYSLQG